MSKDVKFAIVYSAILVLPMLMVFGAAGSATNSFDKLFDAFAHGGGWWYWPLIMFWPWLAVLFNWIRRRDA